jgi:hypothetical protein
VNVEPPADVPNANYRQPSAVPYVFAKGERTFSGQDILTARADTLRRAVAYVIKIEAPIHLDDLMARVVGMWDTKAGRRIAAHLTSVVNELERDGVVQRRDVLSEGRTFARDELIAEIRSVFGFSRTGPLLEATIGSAIDRMLSNGILGEISTGIKLRAVADGQSEFGHQV